jgi:rhamnosyltransferase
MNKVAILLAVYNGREWIDEQLHSILNQENVDVDVFISVDLSTDGSWEYLIKKYSDYSNIVFLPYGEKYGSAGKNFYRLVRDVCTDYYDFMAFSDQDDIWFNDKLQRAIDKLHKEKVDAYSSNVIAFWGDGKSVLIDKAQRQTSYDYLFEAAGPGCTYVLNHDLWYAFREFLLSKQESQDVCLHDWLVYAYARANNYQWYIDKSPSMLYRQHASNQVGANTSFKMWLKRIILVRNGWYRGEVYKLTKLFYNNHYPINKISKTSTYLTNVLFIPFVNKLRRRFRDRVMLILLLLFNFF